MQCGRSCTFPPSAANFLDNWFYDGLLLCARLSAPHGRRSLRRAAPAGSPWERGSPRGPQATSTGRTGSRTTRTLPYPSFADLGYLGFFPFAYAGFILLVRVRVPKLTPGVWLDGITAGLAVGALSAAVVLQAVLSTSSGNFAAVATNLAYPLGDALLLALIVGAFPLTNWRPGRAWLLLGAGLAVMAATDSVYLYQVATDSYVSGAMLDVGWPLSMVLMANAAWVNQRRHRAVDADGRSLLAVPATCVDDRGRRSRHGSLHPAQPGRAGARRGDDRSWSSRVSP